MCEVVLCEFDVLIFDYCGYGDSFGLLFECALMLDVWFVWEYVSEELKYVENRIVVFGELFGGVVVLFLWLGDIVIYLRFVVLILISMFVFMLCFVVWYYLMFLFRFFVLDCWLSIDRVIVVCVLIIVFYGIVDDMVLVEYG